MISPSTSSVSIRSLAADNGFWQQAVLANLSGDPLRQGHVLLGIELRHIATCVPEDNLGGLHPELCPDCRGRGVPQRQGTPGRNTGLTARPVDRQAETPSVVVE